MGRVVCFLTRAAIASLPESFFSREISSASVQPKPRIVRVVDSHQELRSNDVRRRHFTGIGQPGMERWVSPFAFNQQVGINEASHGQPPRESRPTCRQ